MSDERKFLHDLSSPITVLKMNLENLQQILPEWKTEEGKQCVQFLEIIERQTVKLTELIRDRRGILIGEKK
jgi:signal transduction histidine kinase